MEKELKVEVMARMIQYLRNDFANTSFLCAQYRAEIDVKNKEIEELKEKIKEYETKDHYEKPENVATS